MSQDVPIRFEKIAKAHETTVGRATRLARLLFEELKRDLLEDSEYAGPRGKRHLMSGFVERSMHEVFVAEPQEPVLELGTRCMAFPLVLLSGHLGENRWKEAVEFDFGLHVEAGSDCTLRVRPLHVSEERPRVSGKSDVQIYCVAEAVDEEANVPSIVKKVLEMAEADLREFVFHGTQHGELLSGIRKVLPRSFDDRG